MRGTSAHRHDQLFCQYLDGESRAALKMRGGAMMVNVLG